MPYGKNSLEGRFLVGEVEAHGIVVRWVAQILVLPRFRLLRSDWADLHQETLRRVVESLRRERFDRAQDFRSYVQAIARYTAREAAIRRIRMLQHETSEPAELDAVTTIAERRPHVREIAEVVDGIPEGCRELFRMVFFDELSYSEIADRLVIAQGTVKSRVFRCLQKARELLVGQAQGS